MIGYGNSIFLRRSFGPGIPPIDPDAQAFITAAAITNPTQQAAINTLVVDLKGYNVWIKMKALYPFVGGTASTHKFNLKDPRDLDAAFRLTYGGGLTHSSNGITGNGLNGFANTKWIQNVNGTLNNQSIGIYTRTNNNFAGIDMGARIGATSDLSLAAYGGSPVVGRVNTYANSVSITGTPQGFFQTTRTGGASQTVFLNASYVTTAISTSTAILDMPIYLFAMNVNFVDLYHTNRNYAFAYIADGLTIAEAGNLRTAVQTFQTTLGRQV